MSEIIIDYNNVHTAVEKALTDVCPFKAIVVENGKLAINDACRMCKICTRKYPQVFSIRAQEVKGIDKSLWKGIAVYVELTPKGIHPVSFELIGEALKLGKKINQPVYALVIGHNLTEHLDKLKFYGLDAIYAYDNVIFKHSVIQNHKQAAYDFIDYVKPSVLLFGATNFGRALAPTVAAHFKTGLTADCTQLEIKDNSDLVQIRPAFGGNIMARIITPNSRPQLCTVRYKIFEAPKVRTEFASKVHFRQPEGIKEDSTVNVLDVIHKQESRNIQDAEKIVAIGRGVSDKDKIEKIKEFSKSIDAAIACSRPMVECGLFDNMCQIGLSGKTIKPKLIITIGISGAIQFVAGMQNADYIIAINSDKNAEIFNVANLGLVCDYKEILPHLSALIKEGMTNEIQ